MNLSLHSPTKSLPRTNPYYLPTKSPKNETPPVIPQSKPKPPPIPINSPLKPFQSTLNLTSIADTKLSSNLSTPKTNPSKPAALSKSMSHQSILSLGSPANPFTAKSSQKKPFNPFISSNAQSTPPVPKSWTNPFRAPLSSFPPEDPSDTSRLLGIQMFTELLASSNDNTSSNKTNTDLKIVHTNTAMIPSVSVKTNQILDPLTTIATPAATSTLPPMNRKPSTGAPAPVAAKPAAPSAAGQPAQAASDKYSALAELDDLFRSTTIEAPVVAPASAGFQQDVGGRLKRVEKDMFWLQHKL